MNKNTEQHGLLTTICQQCYNNLVMIPKLYIVVPCYNEEEVLPITCEMFLKKLLSLISNKKISDKSKILFIDDGSKDKTWQIITELSKKDPHYAGIAQSRNRGHQAAVLAGLMEAKDKCDITVSIDCDGQDDINAIDEMIEKYSNGAEIVYGVRSSRKKDSFFKRTTAEGFYKVMNKLGTEVVFNHADYRLVSSRVLNEFADFKEVNLFLRGTFPLVGFKSDIVYYERFERIAGKTHYPLKKMLGLAWDGITSLSVKPLHLIIGLGLFVAFLSFIAVIWSVTMQLLGKTVAGWASIISIISFIGGIQLISIGIIGEYIGKIYMEVKHRPRYIISDRTENLKEKQAPKKK